MADRHNQSDKTKETEKNNFEPQYNKMNIIQSVYQGGLVLRRSHICFARLERQELPSWTWGKKKEKKNLLLFCAALLLTLCVWRMFGEPRLAFCWPFMFKIQSVSLQ